GQKSHFRLIANQAVRRQHTQFRLSTVALWPGSHATSAQSPPTSTSAVWSNTSTAPTPVFLTATPRTLPLPPPRSSPTSQSADALPRALPSRLLDLQANCYDRRRSSPAGG